MSATPTKSKGKASAKMKMCKDIPYDDELEKRGNEKKAKMKAKLKAKRISKRKLEVNKPTLKAHLVSSFDIQSVDLKLTSPGSSTSCKKTKTSTVGSVLSHSLSSKKTSSVPQTNISFPSLNSNFKIPKKQVPDKEAPGKVQERVIRERKIIRNDRNIPVNASRMGSWQVRTVPDREPVPEVVREVNYATLLTSLINVQNWLETSPCLKNGLQNAHRNTVDTHSSVVSAVEQEPETPMIVDTEDVGINQEVNQPNSGHHDPQEYSPLKVGQTDNKLGSISQSSPLKVDAKDVKTIYVVLDTNVLTNDLMIVDDLKKNWTGENGTGKVVLVVPWIVLQELDMLKDDKMDKNPSLKLLAATAVRYLHDLLSCKHPQIMGQAILDDSENSTWTFESNDDRILQCCLQCKSKSPCEVILFTNDRNLCNKCLVNEIQAYSKGSIIQAIDKIAPLTAHQKKMMDITFEGKPDTGYQLCNEALDELKVILHDILEAILKTEMYACFGDTWLDIILIKPPWRLMDILKCLQKHWIAVFGNIVNRNANTYLLTMVKKFKIVQGKFKPDDLKSLLVSSLQFLMYFETRSTYKDRLKPSIHALRNLLNEFKNTLLSQHQKASDKKGLPAKEAAVQWLTSLRSPPLTMTSKGHSEGTSKVFSEGTLQQSSPLRPPLLLPGPVPPPPQPVPSQRLLPIYPVPMPDTYLPDVCTPPPRTTTPVSMSNSTSSSDMEHKNVESDSDSIIQNAFQSIWGFINQTCGMLLDSFKLTNPIEYERPSVIPTESDSAHFIPRLFPVITKLKKVVENVLQLPDTAGPDEDVCLELCYLLENFFVILDMSSEWKLEETITPEMLWKFYKNPATRTMLTKGYNQLEEYCTLVYFIIMNVKDLYHL